MNIGQQILFLFSIIGACNGLLLSGFFFLHKKHRTLASFFLGMLLLALSLRVGKSAFLYFNPTLSKVYLQIGLTGCFLIGPSLYYFLRASTDRMTTVPRLWKWSWGIQVGGILGVGIMFPYVNYPWVWNKIMVYVIYGQWAAWLLASGWLLRSSFKLGGFTNPEKIRLLVYFTNCVIFLAYQLSWSKNLIVLYIVGPIIFSLMLYVSIGLALRRQGFEEAESPPVRPERKKIDGDSAERWREKLEKTMAESGLHKNPNLKLNDLAQHINISAHQLSQLLNDNLGKSFSTFINEYRISEACKLISGGSHLTFEAIGYEVGYNSKSTFYAAFRKIKGTTPALFKEETEKMVQ